MISDGILDQGLVFAQKALEAVAQFDSFNDDIDPWPEHDCASLTVDRQRIMWKIDCFDWQSTNPSPNHADYKVTRLVLTIMLASEF